MTRHPTRTALVIGCALLMGAWWPQPVEAQEERLRGTIANQGGGRRSGLAQFTIRINEYTSDDEVGELKEILATEGQDELESALLETTRGNFQLQSNRGQNFHFARTLDLPEGGRLITLVFARPLTLWETRRPSRLSSYPFAFIQLQLDEEDSGQGVVYVAASISFDDDDELVIQSLGNAPISILNVEVR